MLFSYLTGNLFFFFPPSVTCLSLVFKIYVSARIIFHYVFVRLKIRLYKSAMVTSLKAKEGGCLNFQKVSWSPYSLPNYPSILSDPQVLNFNNNKMFASFL